MAEMHLPLSIVYGTDGLTPLRDIIDALESTDIAVQDAVSLLPSMIDGLSVESSRIGMRHLSQESPLREYFLLTLIIAFQENLNDEIPSAWREMLNIEISNQYDSIVTVLTMVVLFYGASLLKDAVLKTVEDGELRFQFNSFVSDLAAQTGKSETEIQNILKAKYGKPAPLKRLAKSVRGFFLPSQREGGTTITFDRRTVPEKAVREVPYAEEFDHPEDFERYENYTAVELEIHAQDRDKNATGWAAIPIGVHDGRLRMKLIEPVTVADVWTKERITGDIVIVSKLTASGYVPSEIHLLRIHTDT